MIYRSSCRHCNSALVVSYIEVDCWIPLGPDGFATTDAKRFDTTNEETQCIGCGALGKLELIEERTTDDSVREPDTTEQG